MTGNVIEKEVKVKNLKSVELKVTVKISKGLQFRIKVGMFLIRLGARIATMSFKIEKE